MTGNAILTGLILATIAAASCAYHGLLSAACQSMPQAIKNRSPALEGKAVSCAGAVQDLSCLSPVQLANGFKPPAAQAHASL